jgi:hypothetical protein
VHVHQQNGDANLFAGSPDAAFQNGIDAELAASRSRVALLLIDLIDRARRPDNDFALFAEARDQNISETEPEMFVGFCGAIRFERKDRDRTD